MPALRARSKCSPPTLARVATMRAIHTVSFSTSERAREARVKKLDIRPLESAERREFTARWQQVQARFVDDPARSTSFADALIGDVMKARGYPVSDFDQRAGDISVDHPVVVDHYHKAHDIAVRHERAGASTEDLRQAMIHYRALFDNLVGVAAPAAAESEPAH